ncbi:MAG: Spy/CpxP family protein refolding chaperone [Pseudomonadota bacterium]
MKHSKKTLALFLAGTLMLGGAGAVMAFGGHHGKGDCGRHGSAMPALSQIESLTDEQRGEIKALLKEQRSGMREQREAMRENRKALREAMQGDADTKALQALADKQGEHVSAMIMARAQVREKVSAILTEEQRAELKQIRRESKPNRHGKHHDGEHGFR